MIPILQTRFGEDGNCWPACWASLLHYSIEELDHLSNHLPDWHEATQAFLSRHGLFYVEYKWSEPEPFNMTLFPVGALIIGSFVQPQSGRRHCVILEVEHHPVEIDGMTQMDWVVVHDPLGAHRLSSEYPIDILILPIKLFP